MVEPAIRVFTYSTDPTTSFQLVLQDDELTYDAVDNPVNIRDWRNPAEWPVGSKPASRTMQYDDLNRVTRIDYQYHDGSNSQGNDDWISPFENENNGTNLDARRAQPSPHVSFDSRVKVQSFGYDWLGNQATTEDDSHGFFDRSLGTVVNNSANDKPYQLSSAQQATGDSAGSVATRYDVTGNLVDMALSRDGTCLPAGATCSQRFAYEWDEVGRMVRARRWDTPNPSVLDPWPTAVPEADLLYHYDSSDSRVIKTAVDQEEEQSHTVYIFSSLELRRATFDTTGTPNDYEDSHDTEVGYLFGHGRLHWDDSGAPEIGGAKLHVLFELGDHLGSSSKVLDKATSELVEASTYMGYGQAESDYRPGRWKGYRADYRFTGKEEDSEVGLTYFGKRFLVPGLGRWASADPLAVHAMGADPNLYAFVKGAVLRAVDPVGLASENWDAQYSDGDDDVEMSVGDASEPGPTKEKAGDSQKSVPAIDKAGLEQARSTGGACPPYCGHAMGDPGRIGAELLLSRGTSGAARWVATNAPTLTKIVTGLGVLGVMSQVSDEEDPKLVPAVLTSLKLLNLTAGSGAEGGNDASDEKGPHATKPPRLPDAEVAPNQINWADSPNEPGVDLIVSGHAQHPEIPRFFQTTKTTVQFMVQQGMNMRSSHTLDFENSGKLPWWWEGWKFHDRHPPGVDIPDLVVYPPHWFNPVKTGIYSTTVNKPTWLSDIIQQWESFSAEGKGGGVCWVATCRK